MYNPRATTSLSIQTKLFLLLLILFVPACGIIIWSGLDHRKHAIRDAEDSALLVVQSLAAQQEQIATGTEQMLSILALLPEVRRLDAQGCNQLFRELNNRRPFYSTIAVATPDGNLFASSTPFESGGVSLSDRKHIKDAISTLDFSAGEHILGRISKVRSINYTYPVLDSDGNLLSILIAGFKLDEYGSFLRKVNLPEGSAVTITDHKGVCLYRLPEHDAAGPGKPFSGDVIERLSGDLDHGNFDRTGQDGVDRIYAFKQLRLRKGSPPYVYMFAGIPKEKILHQANLEMLSNLAILGFSAFTAMSLAWIFGSFVLVKPITHLVNATRRFGSGEMGTRTGLPHTRDELGQLAGSFDDMASLLETRDLERKDAQEALQQAGNSLEKRVQERTAELHASNKQLNREIEERKRAEIKSQDMFRFMQTLVDTIPSPIFYKDNQGIYLGCNTAFEAYLGLSKECIVGRSVFDIAPDDLAHRYHSMDSILFRRHGEQIYESQVSYADGNRHDVIFNKATFLSADGSPAGLVGIMLDITERKKAEQALRKSEERYRLVFENAPLGIMHFDKESQITDCNDRLADIMGAPKDKIIGFNLLLQLRDEQYRDAVFTALEGKTGYFQGDYISVCGDKPSRLRALFQRINSEDGEFLGAVGIFEDITERKLAEMEKERLIGELQGALSKVKLLNGLLPICASCKKIRDDKGYWQQIEAYIRDHSEVEFSHGICPECAKKLYPEFCRKNF